ncbi:unnamed protein product [Cladocopium goreaui]|uniref:Uncharacterized protein n=1 Tax=Cladocopium goreaui TaxID=2562237 RepID=A0A9P1FPR3_9DINO|nr:unnamed protein product [Cladocopium goreaui]
MAGALKGEHAQGAQYACTLHDLAAQVFVVRHASDLSAAVFRLAQHALSLPLAPKAPINAEVMAAACASVAGLAELEAQPLSPLTAQAAASCSHCSHCCHWSPFPELVESSSRPTLPQLPRHQRQTGKSHVLRVLEDTRRAANASNLAVQMTLDLSLFATQVVETC